MARQRQQQAAEQNSVLQQYASSTGSHISFPDGIMHVNGEAQRPTKVELWESSNGTTTYTTIEWQDPVTGVKRTSCNCPGWGMKKKDKDRQCCHTNDLEGKKPCDKKRVRTVAIRTVADARREIPDCHEGRNLRGIMLD